MIKETSLAFKLKVYFEGVQYCSLILIIIFLRRSYGNYCFLWSLLILIAYYAITQNPVGESRLCNNDTASENIV